MAEQEQKAVCTATNVVIKMCSSCYQGEEKMIALLDHEAYHQDSKQKEHCTAWSHCMPGGHCTYEQEGKECLVRLSL